MIGSFSICGVNNTYLFVCVWNGLMCLCVKNIPFICWIARITTKLHNIIALTFVANFEERNIYGIIRLMDNRLLGDDISYASIHNCHMLKLLHLLGCFKLLWPTRSEWSGVWSRNIIMTSFTQQWSLNEMQSIHVWETLDDAYWAY